jgi:hypothetical protein
MLASIFSLASKQIERGLKILEYIYKSDNHEARYYDIADEIYFGKASSNIGLDIVLEDLVSGGFIRLDEDRCEHDYYILELGGKQIIEALRDIKSLYVDSIGDSDE